MWWRTIAVVVLTIDVLLVRAIPHATVSNEDIRDAILQVVKFVKQVEDKLERHEYRERQLGDILKKGMLLLDKKIKESQPLKGSFERLDERLAGVESILLQTDERDRNQIRKAIAIAEDIQRDFPARLEKVRDEIIDRIGMSEPPAQITEPTVSKKDFQKMEKELLDKVDRVSHAIGGMEKELNTIRSENNNFRDLNNKSSENLDKVKRQLDSSEHLLQRYESKLSEYNKIPAADPRTQKKEDEEWQNNFTDALTYQKDQLNGILRDIQSVHQQFSKLPRKDDLNNASRNTEQRLEELRQLAMKPSGTPDRINQLFEQLRSDMDKNHEELNSTLSDVWDISSALAEGISTSYKNISEEIGSLSNLQDVMIQTAENVLDTKRKVEFGSLTITSELGARIREATKDVINSIGERFDTFENSVLDEQTGALANLTSRIGQDIAQVWRQIGIMHQQMTASTDTLNKLQTQTDSYVNGSLSVMDNMKGKVGQINSRMAEVDENLNYLLGRLSLVTREFGQIQKGLGNALDQIRGSFKTVQDKINKGPGPHRIEEDPNAQ